MSFNIPKNVPGFSNPQRQLEDRFWPSSGTATSRTSALKSKVGGLIQHSDKNSLPMYKDKPADFYAPARRRSPFRTKRIMMLITALVLAGIWFFAPGLDDHKERARERVGGLGWLKKDVKAKSKADWRKRQDRVVEAFELSWDAYSRYAWGKLFLPCWDGYFNC
jgi:mannosyl-oligosaccharide alpha-1,2-mannosidase